MSWWIFSVLSVIRKNRTFFESYGNSLFRINSFPLLSEKGTVSYTHLVRIHGIVCIVDTDIPGTHTMFGLLVEVDAEIQTMAGGKACLLYTSRCV